MARQLHYEIQVRDRARGPWRVLEILPERYDALKRAEALHADADFAAIRVNRESFDEATGEYTGLKIYEAEAVRAGPRAEPQTAGLPCLEPRDLYAPHAREQIARVLEDTLARWNLTAFELIHRADALQRLEATGTLYMHALQKIAVAQAPHSSRPVAQIVKALNALCLTAMHKVYRDERENRFPLLDAAGFRAFAERQAGRGQGAYLLGGALAKYLGPERGWDGKLLRLLALWPVLPAAEEAARDLAEAIDAVAAEIVSGPALVQWGDPAAPLGETLIGWIVLANGRVRAGAGAAERALAGALAARPMPQTRAALARRIVAEMTGPRRLDPQAVAGEIRMLRRLGLSLAELGAGVVSEAAVVGAFMSRSRRLVTGEAVAELLDGLTDPEARLARLLDLEENIVGEDNKKKLGGYLAPILSAHQTERHLLAGRGVPVATLQRLARLQGRVLWSGLAPADRTSIAAAIDGLAARLVREKNLIETFAPSGAPPVMRAFGLLQLFAANAVTEGSVAEALRVEIKRALGDGRTVRRYVEEQGAEGTGALAELRALLRDAGLTDSDLDSGLSAA